MNLARLNTFLVLADCLSFSEAAEVLYCSQPAVSLHIKTLEDELGCKLFDRIGKKIYLNGKGKSFKHYAEQILHSWQLAKDDLAASSDSNKGFLTFGASNFVGIYLLPILLGCFNRSYPQVKINMNIRSSKTLISKLENNEVDFLILSDRIGFDNNLYYSKIFYQDEQTLIVPHNHPLLAEKNPNLDSLAPYSMLWKPEHSATRTFLEQSLINQGMQVNNTIEISSLEAIKHSVIQGLGIAFVSKFSVQHEIEHGLLHEINLPEFKMARGIKYVVRKDKILPSSAKNFIQLLDLLSEMKDIAQSMNIWRRNNQNT
ncbi:LysR substrate-binding domain-containing protein [Orbus mooreae]|uniref:LysR substrate-binding domain-containing protein n=1 Tax=Orbus mooreae TaxID=3074107 RepID=UPI00370D53A6